MNIVNPEVNEDSNSSIQARPKHIARHSATVVSSNSNASRENCGQNDAGGSVSPPKTPCTQEENVVSLFLVILKARNWLDT